MGSKGMKRANKKATKGKGLRWKKGQSASHNPEFNKHRQAAKKRPMFGNRGEGNLTEAVLAQHNRLTTESICDANEELMSVGGDTALTAFTNCSLPTFSRLMKNWNAGSFLHKEMIALLAAVTEVLQREGRKETETDYFAALMTTLTVIDTDEEITAAICLLSMLVKRLNEAVLKSESKTACETFLKLLIKYMNSDHCALLRNLLTIMYTFLKVKTNWTESSKELKAILELTTHHKPKVRRMAHHVIRTFLTDQIPESLTVHPCSIQVANFCIEKLDESRSAMLTSKSASRDIFYILSLLQEVIGVFPKLSIKESYIKIREIMNLSNSMVTLCALKSLHGLFCLKRNPENLSADLNAKIINALYDHQPNKKDSECLITWLELMEKALINLHSLNEKLGISHLPRFFKVAVKCFDSEGAMHVVASTLKHLLQICIKPSSEVFQQIIFEDPVNNAVHKMFEPVDEAINIFKYPKAWSHLLLVLAGFFEAAGKHCYTAMMKCLQNLGNLHDNHNVAHISELEKTIGMAIQHIGPRIVLQAIPLQADGEKPDFPRSWLLPLLRDNVRKTELGFFVKHFLPLASKMRKRARDLQQEGKLIESKLFEVVCSQIWSLLPGFCTEPTDLKECFKEVARTLGTILREDPTLRLTVLSALRLLINKNIKNDENKEEIAKYAKNYLPILFNLYTTEAKDKVDEKVRLAVYETCKIYLQIADKELCSTFFMKAKEKLLADSGVFMQHALIDLSKVMIPCIDEVKIQELYEFSKPLLQHTNHTIQKKAYSVVKEICSSESESCRSFVKANLEDLRLLLGGTLNGLTPATRALRLNCLQCIVSQLSENEKSFVMEIIPEAVLSTKENSVKARTAAYNLLVEIGNTLQRFLPDDNKGALGEYVTLLMAGLAGSPHLISASILAIGRVMYEFKDKLDSKIISAVIDNMCLLVSLRSREIVVASLSFFKVLFAAVDTDALAQHVKQIVESLTSLCEDNQRPFRFKAKEIFTRLVRKFGYEMILKMVPENYKKQFANIRKLEARKQRKKDSKDDESDSEMYTSSKRTNDFHDVLADSDDEMFDEDPKEFVQKSRRKKIKAPCLEEGGEDDIVDFLDPAISKRLLTIEPEKTVQNKKPSSGFQVSADGRLIIEEEEDKKSKTKKEKDEKSAVLSELGASSKKNKRKYEDSDDDNEEDKNEEKDSSQGVKRGIHRSLGPKSKRACPGEEFKAKKAGGDIKKGKLEPFAYLPLNRQALNKRKQVKLKGQYKNIVTAAKRGAAVGMKRKSREAKKKRPAH